MAIKNLKDITLRWQWILSTRRRRSTTLFFHQNTFLSSQLPSKKILYECSLLRDVPRGASSRASRRTPQNPHRLFRTSIVGLGALLPFDAFSIVFWCSPMMMMLTKMMRVPRNHDAMLRSRNARARTTRSGAPSALSRRKRGGKSSRVSTPPSSIGMGGSKPKTTTGRRRDDPDDTEENPSGGETQTTRRTFVLLASASVASASETARADAKENNIFDEFPDEERNGDEASCGVKSLIVGPGFGEFESVSKALLASARKAERRLRLKVARIRNG